MKTFITIITSLFFISFSMAQTSLQGKVTAVDTGEELIGANIQIKKNIHSKLDEVIAEDFQIQRLLTNLFVNAIKYSPADSHIIIKTEMDTDKYLKISLIDSGQGVLEENISYLFDKYYRVKQNNFKEGYGLGLYICKIIVKTHGGKIWAKNNELGGLTVTFTLPLAK